MPAEAPHAVLFDMDGTLVDSERLWFQAEAEVLAGLGWGGTWGPEQQAVLLGSSMARTSAYLLELSGADVPRAVVAERLHTAVAERLREEVPLMPGAKDLLAEVAAAGIPAALVTATERWLTEITLAGIGRGHFAVTVCGDEVARPKPDPEPYLTAARLLGADPAACVAVEDSPTGLASAEAAGCTTVAVPGLVPLGPAPRRHVVRSLTEVSVPFLRSLSSP